MLFIGVSCCLVIEYISICSLFLHSCLLIYYFYLCSYLSSISICFSLSVSVRLTISVYICLSIYVYIFPFTLSLLSVGIYRRFHVSSKQCSGIEARLSASPKPHKTKHTCFYIYIVYTYRFVYIFLRVCKG